MERNRIPPAEGRGAGPGRPYVPYRLQKAHNGSLELQWHKHSSGDWCLLDDVEPRVLGGRYGVFIIWRHGDESRISTVLYVGRGNLKSELAECRRSPLFQSPRLRVTWADVDNPRDLDGVATYLYQQLRPIWGQIMWSATPLPVNLPLTA